MTEHTTFEFLNLAQGFKKLYSVY